MNSANHVRYHYGISYPNNIRGVGSPADLLAFFEAMRLATAQPEKDYPFLWSLQRRPVFGRDMLALFDEVKHLRPKMKAVPVTDDVLAKLGLKARQTRLKTEASDLEGLFATFFSILGDRAPEYVRVSADYPEINPLEWGSVRLGPIEPLIPANFFMDLPASAFDDTDLPLWLRDEIFDEAFYAGKI